MEALHWLAKHVLSDAPEAKEALMELARLMKSVCESGDAESPENIQKVRDFLEQHPALPDDPEYPEKITTAHIKEMIRHAKESRKVYAVGENY